MHLRTLLNTLGNTQEKTGVPEWMLGCFKRRCITFYDGRSDTSTEVFWLQGRNMTIDLRLPPQIHQVKQNWRQADQQKRYQLSNYEGWSADSRWHAEQLSWSGGVSFQQHSRWPEPAILQRVGDCMMEFAPSGVYVEDWRLQSCSAGPLISLRLVEERDETGNLRHQGGALIICGNWAGLVLGRAQDLPLCPNGQLRELIKLNPDQNVLEAAFNFETSIGRGNLDDGYIIEHSLDINRMGELLFSLDGFEYDVQNNEIRQTIHTDKITLLRRFTIDSIETCHPFTKNSECQVFGKTWFHQESETLSRYLE